MRDEQATNWTARPVAPYNFVPFSEKVLIAYASEADLPPHNRIDPALKTGELRLTLTADTPVIVGGAGDKSSGVHFNRNGRKQFTIPGSSVKGIIRENLQILGFGHVRAGEDLQDVQILYRDMASKADGPKAELRNYYTSVLGVTTHNVNETSITIPENVCAGYLYHENGNYRIQPAACIDPQLEESCPSKTYFRVYEEDFPWLTHQYASCCEIWFQRTGTRIEQMEKTEQAGYEHGWLLCTGKAVGKKSKHHYVFPDPDEGAPSVEIPSGDILTYRVDFENRENSLRGGGYEVSFWKLPEDGEFKPVFYISHASHIWFGLSLYLRIGYKYPLSHGLPQRDQELTAANEDEIVLDYPHAMLGYMGYRSRVSFGDFTAGKNVQESDGISLVLSGPKPSFFQNYTKDGLDYNQEDFRLNGYKQYWLKNPRSEKAGKDAVTTTIYPVPKGTEFHGTIRFRNLKTEELGLLLWALLLDGGYQSIGGAKPYGYGRMKVKLDQLLEYDPAKLYRSPSGDGSALAKKDQGTIDAYIAAYKKDAEKRLYLKKKHLEEITGPAEFLFMRKTIMTNYDEIRYMDLNAGEYQNTPGILKTVAEFMEEQKAAAEKASPVVESTDPQDWRKQLAQKFSPSPTQASSTGKKKKVKW